MATLRIRHLVTKRRKGGAPVYFYSATPAMRKIGIFSEALGVSLSIAVKRAEELNTAWDEARAEGKSDDVSKTRRGSVLWLIDEYQRSSWYADLSPQTQYAVDAHLKSLSASPLVRRHVSVIRRADCRELYERIRRERGPNVARDRLKWFRRLLSYAVELGLIERNPALKMEIKEPPARQEVWTPTEVSAFITQAFEMGYTAWALGVQLGYDTGQRLSDILGLTWHQFDGEGLTFTQGKTGRDVWVPLSPNTLELLSKLPKRAVHILTGKVRGRPIRHRSYFGRLFREIRAQTPMRQHLTFHDLRRTAATEIYSGGGHIEPITGHRPGSVAIRRYVVPNKAASREAQRARSRGNEPGPKGS